MTFTRRQALGAGATALSGFGATSVWAQATPPRVRRGASTLSETSDDVMAFAEGVALMKRRSDSLSWTRQSRLHREKAQHGNGLFLPWHRLQVSHMERIIGRLTGHERFAMPYWDWQEDRFLPSWVTRAGSPLFERQRGPGANTLDYSRARWAQSRNVARLASDSFTTFAGRPNAAGAVEAYGHNHIHVLVGGLMDRPETAAQDPVFWLHHCNIDRVWATWHNLTRPAYPADWGRFPLTGYIGPDGQETGTWTPSQVTDTRFLGYGYDRPYPFPVFNVPTSGPAGATRREPLGSTVYRLKVEGDAGRGEMRLVIPDEAVARMRAADDTLMIDGVGTATYARNELLFDRSIEIAVASGERRSALGSSPTFVHLSGMGNHDMAAMHHTMGDYGVGFQFGEEVLNLLVKTQGEVAIVVAAEDLKPDLARASAQGASIEMTLTLTETRWV